MFKSGYVAIVGRPNVGKSTLLNQLLGEKLSIVTKKPQTTRHKILGILNRPQAQVLLLDTPGIHQPKGKLNEKIVEVAWAGLKDADVVLHLVFPRLRLHEQDHELAKKVKGRCHIVLVNQVDKVPKEALLPLIQKIQESWNPNEIVPLSALTGDGVAQLLPLIETKLPEGPAYYDTGSYTDRETRFLCEELVREQAMTYLHEELPFGLVAQVESFKEEEKIVRIHMAIIVEREAHKKMVIGKGGAMIKRIGQGARASIEKMLGKKVYLELFVKVVTGWTRKEGRLKEFGID